MTRSTRRTRSSGSRNSEEDLCPPIPEEEEPPSKKPKEVEEEVEAVMEEGGELEEEEESSSIPVKENSETREKEDEEEIERVEEENMNEDKVGNETPPEEEEEEEESLPIEVPPLPPIPEAEEEEEEEEVKEEEEEEKMEISERNEKTVKDVDKEENENEEGKEKKDEGSEDVAAEASKENGEDREQVSNNEPSSKVKNPELTRLWSAVKVDAMDFSSWTSLLQFADAELEDGREAYDAFLDRYPYCYGYWKKYADLEKRKGTVERVMSVFERGIKAIPLSADLWIHYLNHVRSHYEEDFIRSQYERAVAACGLEWRSDKLWDHYVKWETGLERKTRVLQLYDRILRNPTQGLTHQFEMFRDFVKEYKPKEVLSPIEFLELRKEILSAAKEDDEKKDEEVPLPKEPSPDEDSTEEEDIAMKEKIIFARKKIYKETEEFVQGRWKYEDAIKRPYFHMKPLERGQLKNWSDYLDFEIQHIEEKKKALDKKKEESGNDVDNLKPFDDSRVEILFERCLIACALYEEFWFKYIDWLSKRPNSTENIRSVYRRACEHHLREKIDIHLRRAEYEEKLGNSDIAAEILQNLESLHPEVTSFTLKRINLERRRNRPDAVRTLFESTLAKKSGHVRTELAVKYARFLRLYLADEAAALKVLEEAISYDEKNPKPYLQILDVYFHSYPLDLSKIISIFDSAMAKMMPEDLLLFSQRKVEFLEDFGNDVSIINDAKAKNNQLRKKYRTEETNGKSESGRKKDESVSSSTTNSASYNAHHNSQYQQYGARYGAASSYNYNGSGYSSYYQGYGGSYTGY